MASFVILIFFTWITALRVHGELFTALVDLKRAIDAEKGIAEEMLNYVKIEEGRLARIRELATTIAVHSNLASDSDPEIYLSNPVNAYLLVKRFPLNWREVLEPLLSQSHNVDHLRRMLMLRESDLPDEEDLKGAADALMRLQDTYRLKTQMIAKGQIHPTSKSPELNAEECFYLGEYSYHQGDIYHTRMWMQEALDRLDHEVAAPTVNKTQVLDYLSYVVFKQGNYRQALALTNEWLAINPDHQRAQSNKDFFENQMLQQTAPGNLRRGDDGEPATDEAAKLSRPWPHAGAEEFDVYEALCRDEKTHPNPYEHQVTCRYYVPHPHYIIGPVKEEIVYLRPRLVVWHEIIHVDEIEEIKELATPRLKRATVQNSITGQLEFAQYRISKSSWLHGELAPITAKINNRIIALTGLDIEHAEELQVVNYGVGGQYEPHYDFARKREKNAFERQVGNRIATLLFYMSDVDAGGATVFTQLGVKLWPRRGSAAFWMNLFPSGDGDLLTRHAACPVLAGSKWVMNKWFHERGQEFKRPCRLRHDAKL